MKKLKLISAFAALFIAMVALTISTATPIAFSQTTGEYRATWEVPDPPKTGRVGLKLLFPKVTIKNTGTLGWAAGGANEIRVGYRWFYGYGAPIPKTGNSAWEEFRAKLPADIPAGQVVIYPDFQVGVPNEPGDYILRFDMVFVNGDRYFQAVGSVDFPVNVSVKGRDVDAPTAQMLSLPLYSTSTAFPVSWSGKDEDDGSGVASYDVQFKTLNEPNWQTWLSATTLTNAMFTGENGRLYQFRVKATDKAGNSGSFPTNEMTATRVDSLPPVSKVDTLPGSSAGVFLVSWSSFDNLSGVQLYDVQYREGNNDWQDWIVATPSAAGVFKGEAGKTYNFRVRASDYAGNQQDYPQAAQASMVVSAVRDSVYAAPLPSAQPAPAGTKTYYVPISVKNGDNGAGISGIVVQNPGNAPAQIFVRYNNREGAPETTTVNGQAQPLDATGATNFARVATVLDTVPAGGFKSFWAGDLGFPFYNGWVAVVSSSELRVTAIRQASNGSKVNYAAASAATTLYLPYFNKANSLITLANSVPISTEVELRFYDQKGSMIQTDRRLLGRLGSARFGINSQDPALRFTGSVVISSKQPIAAVVEAVLDDGSTLSYPAQTSASATPPQPSVYKEVDGFTTALLLQNPDKDAITAKIEYLDDKGMVIGTTEQPLAGFGQAMVWQGNIPGTTFSGKAKVTTAKGTVVAVAVGAGAAYKGKPFPQ